MDKRVGRYTVVFASPPEIAGGYCVAGPKEGEGPLGGSFDEVLLDTYNGEMTWEKTESAMLEKALLGTIKKCRVMEEDIEFILAGDLLNQLSSSHYALRQLERPFIGLFGACSTMALSMAVGAMLLDGGFAKNVLCATSSHHDTAEKQFRMPTEYGSQRPLTAQWTVTGAGCVMLSAAGGRTEQEALVGHVSPGAKPRITAVTVGKVLDFGQDDANHMGAAMAPAVADTLLAHFYDMGTSPEMYDLIVTGDLGCVGLELLKGILDKSGFHALDNVQDCGCMIFSGDQDVHAGGSGCACSAVVLCGYLLNRLRQRDVRKILFVGSGSLHSKESLLQGETIPGIAHAVLIEAT